MSRVLAVLNQFGYLGLVLGFYYIKVHFPMNQIQLDSALIEEKIAEHKAVYSDSNKLAIVLDDPNTEMVLSGFSLKIKNFLKLEDVVLLERNSTQVFSDYEFVMFVEKGSEPELKISDQFINRFTVYYTSHQDLMSKVDTDAFAYLLWIADKSYVQLSKGYQKVYLKLHFLSADHETKALNKEAVQAIRRSPKLFPTIDQTVKQVAGQDVEVVHLMNFNVKNTFGIFVNSMTPNEAQLKKSFQGMLEAYDEEFVEAVPTLGLNIMIETVSKPIREDAKRYHTYRNCLYLKTSPTEAAVDLQRAVQYLIIQTFGLAKISDEFRKVFGREDYEAVIAFVNRLRERRILKTSLVFLESLRYVNENTNFAIKDEHLQPLQEAISSYSRKLAANDFWALLSLSNYNEHAFFYSTYLFEPYVQGLLLIIAISGVSPLMKVLKEEIILTVVYCRKRKYLGKDINALSSIDWFFERSFVAIDQNDYDSVDEDEVANIGRIPGRSPQSSSTLIQDSSKNK